jgi:TRAP-type transport system periplasmic protein
MLTRRETSLGVVLTALGITGAARAQANTIEINFAHHSPAGTGNDLDALTFIEALQGSLGDRVRVNYFPGGQMGNQRELVEQARLGTLEVAYANSPTLSNAVPELGVMDLPFMFDDLDHVDRVVRGDVGQMISRLTREVLGLEVLGFMHVGFRDMLSKNRLMRLSDFQGVRFRSPEAPIYIEMFRSIGAVPVPLPWGDVYTGLQTGLIDGMETPAIYMHSTRMYEQAGYVLRTRHINTVEIPVMNAAFFDALPGEVREAITGAWVTAAAANRVRAEAEPEQAYRLLEAEGVELVEVDVEELREAVLPMRTAFEQRVPAGAELIAAIAAERA